MNEVSKTDKITSKEIWTNFSEEEVLGGFSDEFLEDLCRRDDKKTFGSFRQVRNSGLDREIYYMASIYSLGRGIKMMAGIPQWLPVPATIDHAVEQSDALYGSQQTQLSRYHLTWSKWRIAAEGSTHKKIHFTMHPMVAIRRLKKLSKLVAARGTIIFVPHSDQQTDTHVDFPRLIDSVLSLPENLKPLVLCLHMEDINRGLHKKLRKFGLPIVTAGNANSLWFADRFYSILRNFQYGTSSVNGSHSFLAEEFGVSFFLLGDQVEALEVNRLHSAIHPEGSQGLHRAQRFDEVFRTFPPTRTVEKDQLVQYALGTDIPLSEHQKLLRNLLWSELFLNGPNMFQELLRRLKGRIGKRYSASRAA